MPRNFPLYHKVANYVTSLVLYGCSKTPYSNKFQMAEEIFRPRKDEFAAKLADRKLYTRGIGSDFVREIAAGCKWISKAKN
jgi:hypothetical protein